MRTSSMASEEAGVSSAAAAGAGSAAASASAALPDCRNRHASKPAQPASVQNGMSGMPGNTPTPNAHADTTPSATGYDAN